METDLNDNAILATRNADLAARIAKLEQELALLQNLVEDDAKIISEIANTNASDHNLCEMYDNILQEINERTAVVKLTPRRVDRQYRVALTLDLITDVAVPSDMLRSAVITSQVDNAISEFLQESGIDVHHCETGGSDVELL